MNNKNTSLVRSFPHGVHFAVSVLTVFVLRTSIAQGATTLQHDHTLFTSVSPKAGERIFGKALELSVGISGPKTKRDTLEVRLNGKIITNLFRRNGKCVNDACEESALVNETDGLSEGTNQVRFRIESPDSGRFHYRRVQFVWQKKKKGNKGVPPVTPVLGKGEQPLIYSSALKDNNGPAVEMSPAYGFTTLSPGGQQLGKWWLQTYNNALRGGGNYVFPAASGMCNTHYEIVLLDRKSMAWLDPNVAGYTPCVDNSTDLKTQLAQVTSTQTAIVGTTFGSNADANLDTTSIGGTDYSKVASNLYPQGYMIVGVGGAPAGTAIESYYVPGETTTPHMDGVFAHSGWGNYDIHPSDNLLYTVDSVNRKVILNGTTYTFGQLQVVPTSGFWMLQFNRYDLSQADGFGCDSDACGVAYDSSAPDQMQRLANDLKNANQRNLIILIAWGQQPGFSADTTGQNVAIALGTVGASLYAAQNLANQTDSFALITSTDTAYSKVLGSSKAMFSSTANGNQGQKGQLTGVLSRNNHYLYQPMIGYQEDLTASALQDFSAPVIAWQQPQPWPVMDTQGRQAAYMYISYQLFQAIWGNDSNKPAGNQDDVRYFYTDSEYNLTMSDQTKLMAISAPSSPIWTNPVDSNTYVVNPSDFNDVQKQLYQEFNNLQLVTKFLGYSGGQNLGNTLVQGSTSSIYSMLANADTVRADLNAPDTTQVGASLADMLTIMSGITNALGVIDGLGPIMGVVTGVLGAGSGIADASQGSAPSQDYKLYMAESDLYAALQKGNLDLIGGYDTMLDNLYTDAVKLNQTAAKVTNTWTIKDQSDLPNVSSFMSLGSTRYYYMQMLPVFYSIDSYAQISTTDITKFGSNATTCEGKGGCHTQCLRLYKGAKDTTNKAYDANGYGMWKALPNKAQSDIRWIGGSVSKNGTDLMTEHFPTADLLDKLFGIDGTNGQLNFPVDQFYTLGTLPQRAFPGEDGTNSPGFNGQGDYCYSPADPM